MTSLTISDDQLDHIKDQVVVITGLHTRNPIKQQQSTNQTQAHPRA